MPVVTFRDSFLIHTSDGHVRTGQVSLEASAPVAVADFDSACEAMERIKVQLRSLIVKQEIAKSQPVKGEALDPVEFQVRLPGVDLTDRRRGPRTRKGKR